MDKKPIKKEIKDFEEVIIDKNKYYNRNSIVINQIKYYSKFYRIEHKKLSWHEKIRWRHEFSSMLIMSCIKKKAEDNEDNYLLKIMTCL